MASTDYLRPIADIEFNHSPNSGTTGYNLINEIVSDEDSTYISITDDTTGTVLSSSFKMEGEIGPERRITTAKAVVVAKISSQQLGGTRRMTVQVGSSSNQQTVSSTSYRQYEFQLKPDDIVYDGNIATADLTLTTSLTTYKNTLILSITQIYIELETKRNIKHLVAIYDRGSGTHSGGDGEYWDEDSTKIAFTTNSGTDIYYLLVNNEDHKSELTLEPEPTPNYTVQTTASGAEYGFKLSGQYYISQNKAQNNSAAVCQVNFTMQYDGTVEFAFINYAQEKYDYGLIGAVDQKLETTSTADADVAWTGYSSNSANEQKKTIAVPAGSHFIQLKYLKNNKTDSYNDDFRWRINALTFNETPPKTYNYELSSIEQPYEIKAIYDDYRSKYSIKNNGSWQKARLAFQKINGQWIETSETQPSSWAVNDTIAPSEI